MSARVYSYMRFSDAKQADGASSDRQTAYAQRWAQDNGLVLDESLSMRDEGLSAYHQRHIKQGALGVFLGAVETGAVSPGSVLVVEGLDRLSRAEPILAQAQLASIINAGVSVVTASDNKVYSRERLKANPMDLVYSLLVMIRAHEESDTKSKRVRDAIRRQCLGWQAGTYTGLIRYGNTPSWLQVVDGAWQVIEHRAEALRAAVAMFRRGLGAGAIARELHAAGMAFSLGPPTSGHILRLLPHPALIGDKHVELDGETFVLANYYPAIISRDEQSEVLRLMQERGRRRVKGDIPAMLTGIGITTCGYCGGPMKSQTMANRRKADGVLTDGNRRITCVKVNHGDRCSVAGSCSVVPFERALMEYCSDLVNLQSLYTGDRSAGPRALVAEATAKLKDIDAKLERLMDALLSADGAAPATFTARARELEAQRAKAQDALKAAERELAAAARADITGADQKWRTLAEGVLALDKEARLQARQLVADTFERIVIYHRSIRPDPAQPADHMDMLLQAKGGVARMLRIKKDGSLVAAETLGELPPWE